MHGPLVFGHSWILVVALAGGAHSLTQSAAPEAVQAGPLPAPPLAPSDTVAPALGDSFTPFLQTDAVKEAPRGVPVELDDLVPLPVAEEVKADPAGDRLVRAASGDPFFLGFAAGPYYPPADELIDPRLINTAFGPKLNDGRPANEVFGFVMFQKRMNTESIEQLQALGVRLLGFHPHYSLKAALPMGKLDQIVALPFVRWIGAPQGWQKLHPALEPVHLRCRAGL